MEKIAVALCRVSTAEQRVDGNSLESQQGHVYEFAHEKLSCEIDHLWSLDVSSKAGKNVKRRDLIEIREYCKKNRHIKYFIVDKVNRLMREIKMFYWFIQELEMIGVSTYFADPEQQDLNNNDPAAQLKTFIAIFIAEQDNKDRANTCLTRMKDRVLLGYSPFNVHQGYEKTNIPGLHKPNKKACSLLKEALEAVASGRRDKYEALRMLTSKGYKTPTGKELRIDKFEKILLDDYYAGLVSVKTWGEKFQGVKGMHAPIITIEQHESIKTYLTNRKTFKRNTHNPEFPMANLLFCECGGKFTGGFQGNGNGKHYPKYRCRKCGKQYLREEVHKDITNVLSNLQFCEGFENGLISALGQVWNQELNHIYERIKLLQRNLNDLNERKNKLIMTLAENPTLKDDITAAIEPLRNDISDLESQISESKKVEDDFEEFVQFALNFVNNKSTEWWQLDYNDKEKCKQLMFPDEIFFRFSKKVCTPQISPILILNGTKKEAFNASNFDMVELRGVAPLSKLAHLPLLHD